MKWVKFLIVLIICTIIVVIAVLLNRTRIEEKYSATPQENPRTTDYYIPEAIHEARYFSVKACVNEIMSYAKENKSETLYNLLNTEYIAKNDITKENVLQKVNLSNIKHYRTKEAYELIRRGYRHILH